MNAFGPFQVDPRTRTLLRDGVALDLAPRAVEVLAFLADRTDAIVTKTELLERFWPGGGDHGPALLRAIADIRKALGETASAPRYLQTVARRGYRFASGDTAATPGAVDAGAPPLEPWIRGDVALESLDPASLPQAIAAFERAVAAQPSNAAAYAGLANAYLLGFEATWFTSAPDTELLDRAITAARRACAVDATHAEAWATLGYLLTAAGRPVEARDAARKATTLEPGEWRHQFRLADATWGEERLRGVDRLVALAPSFAPARMLSAMVHVARGALERAQREVELGERARGASAGEPSPVTATGLDWLRGLLLASRGDRGAALRHFDREVAAGASGPVYAQEFVTSARVAAGFVHLEADDLAAAAARFHEALAVTPRHARASLGLLATRIRAREARASDETMAPVRRAVEELERAGNVAEAALVSAGAWCALGRSLDAVDVLERLLAEAPDGPAGWMIPVDPMLAAVRFSPGRSRLLARLADRAR